MKTVTGHAARSHERRIARAAGTSSWFDSPWRIAGRAVSWALMIAVVALVLGLTIIPRMLGGDALTVLSGSMEPTFSAGDVVVVRGIEQSAVCSDVSVGSIITYLPTPNDPTLITHRVVGKTIGTFDDGTQCRLITHVDANSAADEPVSPRQVRGLFLYGVPDLGWARQWIGQNTTVVAVVAGALLIGWGLWSSFRRPRSTVVSVPRPVETPPAPASTPAAVLPEGDHAADLRERELALRERELALRERELDYALRRAEWAGSGGPERPMVDDIDLLTSPQSAPSALQIAPSSSSS